MSKIEFLVIVAMGTLVFAACIIRVLSYVSYVTLVQ